MSGNSDESDSWGSLLINGILNRMVKGSGLKVVKSSDQNSDHEQGQKNAQQLPKNVVAKKEKDDFQQKKPTREPCKSQYKGDKNGRILILIWNLMLCSTNVKLTMKFPKS